MKATDFSFEYECPTSDEIKKICVWLLKAGYNDHSFDWNFKNGVRTILHYAGYYHGARHLEALFENYIDSQEAEDYDKSLEIINEMISYIEEM